MKSYFQLARRFLLAGAQFGVLMGLVTGVTSDWIVGVFSGLFSCAMICLGVPFFLLMLEQENRGPSKLQFRIRTILVFSAAIALALASWQWTNTYGVRQLVAHYEANAREVVHGQIEEYSLDQTEDEILDRIVFLANPHAVLPFVITVETDDAFKIHYSAKSSALGRNTHVWFFGYLSDPLSKVDFMFYVLICALVVFLVMLYFLMRSSNASRRQRLASTDSDAI